MNIVRLFAMGVGVVLLLVILEGFRRVIVSMGLSRRKAVVFIAGNAIGFSTAMYGIRELWSGRWIGGVIWIPTGIGINFIVAREIWPLIAQKKTEPLVRTRTGRLLELLAFVLIALSIGIILMLSGRSDFSW